MGTYNESIKDVINNKSFFSGIAMLMVLAYHLFVMDEGHYIWTLFFCGYLGVDIFLLLSGYSLCFSYNKNPIHTFYYRRIKRIVPLYILMGICSSVVFYIFGQSTMSAWDWICNITSLNYYKLGGSVYEWYLSSMFLFYFLFPVFYAILKKNYVGNISWSMLISIFWITFITLALIELDWNYLCAIGRIPIFITGIMLFLDQEKAIKRSFTSFAIVAPICLILVLCQKVGTFVFVYSIAPLFIVLIARILRTLKKSDGYVYRVIMFVGSNSLEIYVANTLVCVLMKSNSTVIPTSLYYLMLYIVFIPIIIVISKLIGKINFGNLNR